MLATSDQGAFMKKVGAGLEGPGGGGWVGGRAWWWVGGREVGPVV
jgi:hypothetical protein